jgi:hypothetical protein
MSATLTHDPVPGGPWAAVARFLTQYSTETAEALHLALQSLRARVEPDRVLACELAWEMHTHGYWSQIRRPDGGHYESEETYFRDILGRGCALAPPRAGGSKVAAPAPPGAPPPPLRSGRRAAGWCSGAPAGGARPVAAGAP